MKEKIKILIVDDRPENLLTLESVLDDPELTILKAYSGNEALALTLQHDFAVVFLDVMMPEMDGFETAELMRSNSATRHIPIIFITAIGKEPHYIFRGYEAGAVDYIFKPMNPTILKNKADIFVDLYRQRKRAEKNAEKLGRMLRKLRDAQRETRKLNRDLKDLLYITSHDLQSPLVSIMGYSSRLLREMDNQKNDQEKFFLERISLNAVRMRTLITDLLDISRLNTQKNPFTLFDPTPEVENLIREMEITVKEKNAEVKVNPMPEIFGDRIRITIVFRNLLKNALLYGGTEIQIGFKEGKGYYVKDNGIGVPESEHKNIFNPGERLKEIETEGSGMGLYFCRKVIALHKGTIGVENNPEGGSIFYFDVSNTASRG